MLSKIFQMYYFTPQKAEKIVKHIIIFVIKMSNYSCLLTFLNRKVCFTWFESENVLAQI